MNPPMTAADIKQLLNLAPHPREGGWYIRTYESAELIDNPRYPTPRRTATAIYYLLEPGTFSEMHRLRSDELFHFYLGDPVEMLQLHPDGTGHTLVLGQDLRNGASLQALVPRDVWQGTHLVPGGQWALLGCTVSPGFEFEDYESAPRAVLTNAYPAFAKQITALTNS